MIPLPVLDFFLLSQFDRHLLVQIFFFSSPDDNSSSPFPLPMFFFLSRFYCDVHNQDGLFVHHLPCRIFRLSPPKITTFLQAWSPSLGPKLYSSSAQFTSSNSPFFCHTPPRPFLNMLILCGFLGDPGTVREFSLSASLLC